MTDCTTHVFDGCACSPGTCRSLSVELYGRGRHYEASVKTFRQKFNYGLIVFGVSVGLAGLMATALVAADHQFAKQDLRQQEWRNVR